MLVTTKPTKTLLMANAKVNQDQAESNVLVQVVKDLSLHCEKKLAIHPENVLKCIIGAPI